MTEPSPRAVSAESPPGTIRILHLTDFHFLAEAGQRMLGVDTEASFADVLETALSSGLTPDLALLTGDLVQDPVPSAYQRLRARLEALPCPVYCLPGNHDDPRLIEAHLAGGNVRFQPSVLLDHWQLICLDSTLPRRPHGQLGDEQRVLLESLLTGHPERHALVALHHHSVPSGSVWMDTMLLGDAEQFLSTLDRHPLAKAVVFGHVHQLIDRVHGNIRLLATPSTCFQFKPLQVDFALDALPAGYRWIDLLPDGGIETTAHRARELPAGLDLKSRGY